MILVHVLIMLGIIGLVVIGAAYFFFGPHNPIRHDATGVAAGSLGVVVAFVVGLAFAWAYFDTQVYGQGREKISARCTAVINKINRLAPEVPGNSGFRGKKLYQLPLSRCHESGALAYMYNQMDLHSDIDFGDLR